MSRVLLASPTSASPSPRHLENSGRQKGRLRRAAHRPPGRPVGRFVSGQCAWCDETGIGGHRVSPCAHTLADVRQRRIRRDHVRPNRPANRLREARRRATLSSAKPTIGDIVKSTQRTGPARMRLALTAAQPFAGAYSDGSPPNGERVGLTLPRVAHRRRAAFDRRGDSAAVSVRERLGAAVVEFAGGAGERLRMAKPKPKPRSLVVARIEVFGRDRTRLRHLREDVIALGRKPLARLSLIAFG
jgi:hypothetical protein